MRLFKSHPILRLGNNFLVDSPQPLNLSYMWNFGSLLAICLIIQIITGVTLAMHYNPSVAEAFNSVEHSIVCSLNQPICWKFLKLKRFNFAYEVNKNI
jgi:ubiquinol-cytochrome c reductase cytochrome b subunit